MINLSGENGIFRIHRFDKRMEKTNKIKCFGKIKETFYKEFNKM